MFITHSLTPSLGQSAQALTLDETPGLLGAAPVGVCPVTPEIESGLTDEPALAVPAMCSLRWQLGPMAECLLTIQS